MHAPEGALTSVHFHFAEGFGTPTLAHEDDSLVRVSRRVASDHYASIVAERVCAGLGPCQGILQRAITLREEPHALLLLSTGGGQCWPRGRKVAPARPARVAVPESGHRRFPFNNFTYCLTLFPKCFSSFDHSTCALSVSGRYLALGGVYLPICAAVPDYATRRRIFVLGCSGRRTGLSPSMASRSRELRRCRRPKRVLSRLQLGPRRSRISNLSCCRFTRRYWGNPCWFLFLRLLICLSSAGSPA